MQDRGLPLARRGLVWVLRRMPNRGGAWMKRDTFRLVFLLLPLDRFEDTTPIPFDPEDLMDIENMQMSVGTVVG